MPQAALPDINTILITYRREIISDLNHNNYSGVIGSLMAINAVLPEKYQVEISTNKYNETINHGLIAVCGHCKAETDYKDLVIKKVLQDSFKELLTNNEFDRLWSCPKCNKDNRLSKTQIIKPEPKTPYYIGIVPEPPERNDGMIDRTTYRKRFIAWARNFLVELEHQMGRYRIEYVPKDNDFDNESVESGGEEYDI